MSTTKYTPGPWHVSGTSGREHEVRLLTNDGAIPIMGPDPDQEIKRIALVDCQTRFKRGQGWQTECDEREANARLIAAAPTMHDYIAERAAAGDAKATAILEAINVSC